MAAAPEWRFDPLTCRQVLIAPARGERPLGVGPACPFCEGHESETPPEVYAVRTGEPNGPGWRVRVVSNRYAALEPLPPDSPLWIEEGARGWEGQAGGVAEVFLESPDHQTRFRDLPLEQATLVLQTWRDRLAYWRADGRLAFAQVFKNEGPRAGASVEHCHSQLIGIPFVPHLVAEELAAVADPECPFCCITAAVGGPLFVTGTDRFVASCPLAPRFPGETWLVPQVHAPRFEDTTDEDLGRLAAVLRDVLHRVAHAFGDPDYNLIVKSAPFRYEGPYHWRIEILPRTTTPAGWEWGTGLLINTLFPERAAEMLRG